MEANGIKQNFPQDFQDLPDNDLIGYFFGSRRGDLKNFRISAQKVADSLGIISLGGAPIYFEGNQLPSLNNTDEPVKRGDWTNLPANQTYLNINGGNNIETPADRWSIGVFNGSSWSLKDMGALPQATGTDVIEDGNQSLTTSQGVYNWGQGLIDPLINNIGSNAEKIELLLDHRVGVSPNSYNHANPDTFVVGRLDNTTGEPTGSTWKTSDFIEWGENSTAYFGSINETNGNPASNLTDVCQYDAAGVYIPSKVNVSNVARVVDAKYFRISTTVGIPLVAFVPIVNIPINPVFKPLGKTIGTNQAVFANNIIQNVELVPNGNLVATAEFIPKSIFDKTLSGIRYNASYTTSVIRIKVKPNTVYSRNKNTLFGANYNAVGFLKDKDRTSDVTLFADTLTFTTPSDCQYIVITGAKANDITVVEGSTVKSIVPTVKLKSKEGFDVLPNIPYEAGKNIFDKSTMIVSGKLVDYVAKTIVDSLNASIAIIPVTGGLRYARNTKNTNVSNEYQGVLELTSYNFDTGAYATNLGYNLDTFVASSNVKYIAVTISNGSSSIADTLQIEIGDTSTTYEAYEKRALFDEKFKPFITQELIDAILAKIPSNNSSSDMKEIKNLPSNYGVLLDDSNFRIYSPIRKNSDTSPDIFPKIVALGGNVAIYAFNSYTLEISEKGIEGLTYINNGTNPNRISLSSTTLPGSTNSNFQSIHILPYKRGNVQADGASNDHRVVIVTKGGKIYHNKPQRTVDGTDLPLAGDHLVFDESVVWDMPHRRLPHPSNTAFPYYKNPGVPEVSHSPILNTDSAFVDTFGNGGFGIAKTEGTTQRTRFMIRFNGVDLSPFRTMGGVIVEPQNMWLGTYNPSSSYTDQVTRECVFHSKDGREFYNVYEFIPSNILGTPINTTSLPAYNANTLAVMNRDMEYPLEGYTPTNLFKPSTKVNIASISIANKAIVTTDGPHGLPLPQGIIAIQTASGATVQSEYQWMLNDAAAPTDYGNTVFFAYKKLTATTFELHEYINANTNNLQSRHIHCLNRCKDGVTIGTGEEYYNRLPIERSATTMEGWYPQTHYVHLRTPSYVATKLNSSELGLMRPLGFILMDDIDQNLLSASDSDIAGKNVATADGGTLYRGATGLFKGKLVDINDRSKFETILESPDVCFFFQKVRDMYIYADVKGFVAISQDLKTWSTTYLNTTIFKLGGADALNRVCVDGMIVYKK